jgi:protein SCO1
MAVPSPPLAPTIPPAPRTPSALVAVVGAVALVLALAVVRVVVPSTATELPGMVRDPAPHVGGLTFVDQHDGQTSREVELVPASGELVLLYFGYLSCPDVCPTTMADIARARREIGPDLASRVTVAFVTLDPERDDPAAMRAYLEHFFDEDHRSLLAPPATLDGAVERLGLRYEVEPHESGDDHYDVAHSALTYVIDDTGTVVRELPFGVTSDELAQVMRALLP